MTEVFFNVWSAYDGLRLFVSSDIRTPEVGKQHVTPADWEAEVWVSTEIPKPTFSEMVEYALKWDLRGKAGVLEYQSHQLNQSKKAVLNNSIAGVIDSGAVHTGKGLGHMAGLLQMVEQATTAGSHLPQIQMQNPAGGSHRLHTQADIRKILEAAAKTENIVESCHNIVIGRWRAKNNFAQDSSNTTAKRIQAAEDAKAILTDYESLLKAEVDKYDSEALPTDLAELKAVLIERLEAAALDHIKNLRGVVTQQGIDLPATCPDAATAEASVATFRYKGAMLINRAVNTEDANRLFKLYTSNINKVVVANAPVFTRRNGPTLIPGTLQSPFRTTANKVELAIQQLETQPPNMLQVQATSDYGRLAITRTLAHRIDFELTITKPGATATFDILGRNLCGPAKIKVIMN